MSIDSNRLIDTIDDVYVIDNDNYRFIGRFSDIDFYRLPRPGVISIVKKRQFLGGYNRG